MLNHHTKISNPDIPRRDATLISTKKFLQTLIEKQLKRMLCESTANLTNFALSLNSHSVIISPPYTSKMNVFSYYPPFVNIVYIISHVCYDNYKTTELIANICQRLFE